MLAIYGGADEGIPPDAIEAFDRAMDAAGVEHRTVVYEDAPHSFFDRKATEFADASADAWAEMLDFMGRQPGDGDARRARRQALRRAVGWLRAARVDAGSAPGLIGRRYSVSTTTT